MIQLKLLNITFLSLFLIKTHSYIRTQSKKMWQMKYLHCSLLSLEMLLLDKLEGWGDHVIQLHGNWKTLEHANNDINSYNFQCKYHPNLLVNCKQMSGDRFFYFDKPDINERQQSVLNRGTWEIIFDIYNAISNENQEYFTFYLMQLLITNMSILHPCWKHKTNKKGKIKKKKCKYTKVLVDIYWPRKKYMDKDQITYWFL